MALMLRMCFKKPKLPPKSQEDIDTENELKAMRAAQQREIAIGLGEEKDAQTEAAFARIMGMTGNRSLITGPKGGAGYLGANSGRSTGRGTVPAAPSTRPTAPPIMGAIVAGFSGFSGSSLIGSGASSSVQSRNNGGGTREFGSFSVQEN